MSIPLSDELKAVFRRAMALLGLFVIMYLLVKFGGEVAGNIIRNIPLLVVCVCGGIVSLLIQVAAFRSQAAIVKLSFLTTASIWCTSILANHFLPFAGGLGYRFLALKSVGVGVAETLKASIVFVVVSSIISILSLLVVLIGHYFHWAYLVLALISALITFLSAIQLWYPSVLRMAAWHLAQVFSMAVVVFGCAVVSDSPLPFYYAIALGCLMRLGTIVSLTPASMGVQEGIIFLGYSTLGLSDESALQVALMIRVVYLIAASLVSVGAYAVGRGGQAEAR